MTPVESTAHERASDRARARAQRNGHRIGAVYLGPAGPGPDTCGWRGVVAVSDGTDVIEALVTAHDVSPDARVEPGALAVVVEELVGQSGGLAPLRKPGASVVLAHRHDGLFAIFPRF
jgi:hypothetical protein